MKFLPLIWAGVWRKPARAVFTLLAIVAAFMLFGILGYIDAGFRHLYATSHLDQLWVAPRTSGTLPISYLEDIQRIPGVSVVAPIANLFGYFQDPKNGVFIIACDDRLFDVRLESTLTQQQRETLTKTRDGVAVSVGLAAKYGWKLGDRFTLEAPGVPQKDGTKAWSFEIVAIPDSKDAPPGEAIFALANYTFVDELRARDTGTVARFIVRISDPDQATRIAREIETKYANSSAPTHTVTDRSSVESQLQSLGDVNFFVDAIVGAVLFMLIFLTSNTMMESVRERIPEFAVLKTLGYSNAGVLAVVVCEAIVQCAGGGVIGLSLAMSVFSKLKFGLVNLPRPVGIPWSVIAIGVLISLAIALLSSLLPVRRLQRLSVVDALAGR